MQPNRLIYSVVLCAATLIASSTSTLTAETAPNVVLIFADDLGYGDIGCYGATKVKTPNIDRLAKEGRMFTDAHSASAVCSPSRYALLTGEYPFRAMGGKGVWGPLPPTTNLIVPTDTPTIGKVFKNKDYATACIGKWHLGFTETQNRWNKMPLRPGPWDVGFDYYFGVPQVNSGPPFVLVENDMVVGWDPADPLVLNSKNPFTPAPRFKGTSQCGLYGDFIHELDWMVGEVLKCLEENHLSDNTLVIFTSDNGGMLNLGGRNAMKDGHRPNGDLLGFKFGAWEGGHRVPFIARWPGKIEAGSKSDQLICNVDMLSTFMALTGQNPASLEDKDSINVLPALVGNPSERIRKELVLAPFRSPNLSLRKGKWLYIGAQGSGGFSGGKPDQHAWGGAPAAAFAGSVNSDIENGKIKKDAPPSQLYDLEVTQLRKAVTGGFPMKRTLTLLTALLLVRLVAYPATAVSGTRAERSATPISPPLVERSDFYVDAVRGDDGNDGRVGRPFRTIQKAVDTMCSPGSLCTIRPGIYHETVRFRQRGAADKPLRFQAQPGAVLSGAEELTTWIASNDFPEMKRKDRDR
jgi:arylsulfatase A-like enzyme